MYLIEDGSEVSLDADMIIHEAVTRTGLDDFGDLFYKKGLNTLISSFKDDVWYKLKDDVRSSIGRSLAHLLEIRLRVIDDRKKYPEIQSQVIEKPVFFIGMGRTGSTMIHTLMSQDPANVAPQLWETMMPSPPPRFGMGEERKSMVSQMMNWYLTRMPDILSFHPYFIEENYMGLAECGSIGEMSFASYLPYGYLGTIGHFKWFSEADNTAAIAFHKMFLQHLQWGREGRTWICKAVEHGIFLDALLKIYPDATFVWTHRDPLTQAASLASSNRFVRQALLNDPGDAYQFGQGALLAMKLAAEKGMTARRATSNRQFIDIYYPDLVTNPLDTVRKIYDITQRPLTAEAELKMATWLRNNSSDKGGGHSYTAEEFGLTQKVIETELKYYLDWFGDSLAKSEQSNANQNER